jgi:hypothetical protein
MPFFFDKKGEPSVSFIRIRVKRYSSASQVQVRMMPNRYRY